jgi:hypothetical protein
MSRSVKSGDTQETTVTGEPASQLQKRILPSKYRIIRNIQNNNQYRDFVVVTLATEIAQSLTTNISLPLFIQFKAVRQQTPTIEA